MIELLWPWMLALLPLPWLVRKRRRQDEAEAQVALVPFFPAIARLQDKLGGHAVGRGARRWQKLLALLAWIALVLAATRPQWTGEPIQLDVSGRDLMLAVDVSPSMKEEDMVWRNYQTNRLDVVKNVVSEFVDKRQGDRVGLILFGTQPYIQVPLTFDLHSVKDLLDEAMIGIAGRATAIGDAITLAVKRLRDRPENSRVLILLTDGANTAGEIPPLKAAELAAKEHIKIYSIGIGAEEMLVPGFFGMQRQNPSADLDEDMLKKLADMTGGQYFRARNTGELEMVYEAVNQLEPVKQEQKFYRPTTSLYHWPLGFSLALSLCLAIARGLPRLRANPAPRQEKA